MTLRQYLALMSFTTAICWVTWLFVIWTIDPQNAGVLGMLFFYFSLFLSIVGSFSVVGFSIKRLIIKNDDVIFRHVRRTFRQGLLFGLFIIFALWLLQNDLLKFWNGALLIILYLVLEGIIFANRKYHNQEYVQ